MLAFGDGCAVCAGAGWTLGRRPSVFFSERIIQKATISPAAKTAAAIANGFQFTVDLSAPAGALCFTATSAKGCNPAPVVSASCVDWLSSSLIAATRGGTCFERG